MILRLCALAVLTVGLLTTPLSADVVSIGSGAKTAYMTMVFDDSAPSLDADSTHLFIVSFDGTMTSEELLMLAFPTFVTYLSTDTVVPPLPAGDSMRLEYFDFDGDGTFDDALLDAASYSGDTGESVGFDPTWTFWTRDDTSSAFATSSVGISDRIVDDGFHDAFVFGSFGAVAPPTTVPEPSSFALMAAAGVGALAWRRRRERELLEQVARGGAGEQH